ncbi:Urease accessory protein like [Actinidia chinensis var. chinensis]|uniref:Urease accessory protein like n=1 Tax=Actinidia chinensis var. chinensis TaxID=1590841 RepID=A0A2R6QY40_ACTCC|nr:Urease accessory protein like [Actinidia chinensis var. chinensis]
MCYEVKCSTCGKTSWGGCGMHVASVHKRIPEGQHCQCKGWPGVKTGGDNSAATTTSETKTSSYCIIM